LEEINEGLKHERVKQNTLKNKLEEELNQNLGKMSILMAKIKSFE
jgi:hypothetical protein